MIRAERYAVVSCHVERPLDDRCWAALARLRRRRPGGFAIAALVRPPDASAGEDGVRWLERVRRVLDDGPLGQHTHWTAPTHARPTGGDPAARVREEAARLRDAGLRPTLFCGGGWYMDVGVAEAVAELGYADCTGRPDRPRALGPGDAWLAVAEPGRLRLPSGRVLVELPTTHSIGAALRAALASRPPAALHVYFHDYDLLDRRRHAALVAALLVLGRRRRALGLDELAETTRARGPELPFAPQPAGGAGPGAPVDLAPS